MDQLSKAIAALKAEGARLENELKRVRSAVAVLQGLGQNGGFTARRSTPSKMSAAGRARIAAAQRRRWAKWKKEQKKAA
jgi:hypothetical protein